MIYRENEQAIQVLKLGVDEPIAEWIRRGSGVREARFVILELYREHAQAAVSSEVAPVMLGVVESSLLEHFLIPSSQEFLSALMDRRTLAIFVRPDSAPRESELLGEKEYSFLASRDIFEASLQALGSIAVTEWLFNITGFALTAGCEAECLLVRELPIVQPFGYVSDSTADIVIPHRGDLGLLRVTLEYVRRANPERRHRPVVVFDEQFTPEHVEVLRAYPEGDYFRARPDKVGPYMIRQWAGMRSDRELMVFQDADDAPTLDRFSRLAAAIEWGGYDMVGCHELRYDEITREVVTRRFPVDVDRAMANGPTHALLHGTAGIRVSAFKKNGGFSTKRRFGGDTEFLLRNALLGLRMRNVNEFLYVRRRQAGSLSTTPGIHLGSELRLLLSELWQREYRAIRAGSLTVEGSHLGVKAPVTEAAFEPVGLS